MSRILLVEDEERMGQSLLKGLQKAGYEVVWVKTGVQARIAKAQEFDVVILDWMLPDISGLDVLHYWRGQKLNMPVLMLTAKTAVPDKVTGLDFGADDYLSKFFEWEELLARINALIRRSHNQSTSSSHRVGAIEWDQANKLFIEGETLINLTPSEYKILSYFFKNPNKLITRQQLLTALYGYDDTSFSNVIERHIKSIRQKFTYDPIITVRGFGYRLHTSGTVPSSAT